MAIDYSALKPPLSKDQITHEMVRDLLDYDPETGIFTWKYRPFARRGWNAKYAGTQAGALMPIGYVCVSIFKYRAYAHRLAVFWMTGEWPPHEVDHINATRDDNRWANLRLATHEQNLQHRARHNRNSSTGIKGVFPAAYAPGKWKAAIIFRGYNIHLGTFTKIEEAEAAYQKAAKDLFGEFHHDQ